MGIKEFRTFLSQELELLNEKKLEFILIRKRISTSRGIPRIMDKDVKNGKLKGIYFEYDWHKDMSPEEFEVRNFKILINIDSEIDSVNGILNNDELLKRCWNFYRNYQASLVNVVNVTKSRPKIESASLHRKLKKYIDEKIHNRP